MDLDVAGPGNVFVWHIGRDGSVEPNNDPLTPRVIDAPRSLEAFLAAIGSEPRSPAPVPSTGGDSSSRAQGDLADPITASLGWLLALVGTLAAVGALGAFFFSHRIRKRPETRR